jgi:lysophospholipid hydrolase
VIFDIVLAKLPPRVTPEEKKLAREARRVRKELVLLHDVDTECPSNTSAWLKKRPWISSHFHLKPTRIMFTRKSVPRLIEYYTNEILSRVPSLHSDFSRLGRHITGTSVGVVLGGGGARGAAHLGILKAMQEAGIPIDKIGGVSIGALVAGLFGVSRNVELVTEKTFAYFDLNKYYFRHFFNMTYPVTSITTGSYFNYCVKEIFGTKLEIEDFWLPFFCCTTDVSISRQRIHTTGTFWKYCRASMSYAWFVPPLCDPVDGHLLMDGCYVNNVPGDVMAAQGCKYIMAVDVTALDDRNLYNYGETLSGWKLLWNRLNPFAETIKIPDQAEIQMRLSFCSHYKNLDELMNNPNYEYIKPPIDKYGSLSVSNLNKHCLRSPITF